MANTAETVKTELKQDLDKAVQALYQARDEAKVRIHLASLEAKDAWSKLEPTIDSLEDKIRDVSEGTIQVINSTTEKVQKLLGSIGNKH